MSGVGRGYDWELIPTPSEFSSVRDVCHVPQKGLVAIGINAAENNPFLFSRDGVTWETKQVAWLGKEVGSKYLKRIIHGNGLTVAVGDNSTILTSTDLHTWFSRYVDFTNSSDTSLSLDLSSVAYGNGIWVAVGNGLSIVTSNDGITWTARTHNPIILFYEIYWDSNIGFIGAGFIRRGFNDYNTVIMTSYDGSTWNENTILFNQIVVGFSSMTKGSKFVLVGGGNNPSPRCFYSTNGLSWVSSNSLDGENFWMSVCVGSDSNNNELYVAVGYSPSSEFNNKSFAVSNDGVIWEQKESKYYGYMGSTNWYGVRYLGGLFIACGYPTDSFGKCIMISGAFTEESAPPRTQPIRLWKAIEHGESMKLIPVGLKKAITSGEFIEFVPVELSKLD